VQFPHSAAAFLHLGPNIVFRTLLPNNLSCLFFLQGEKPSCFSPIKTTEVVGKTRSDKIRNEKLEEIWECHHYKQK
jgi:hypothetical protein